MHKLTKAQVNYPELQCTKYTDPPKGDSHIYYSPLTQFKNSPFATAGTERLEKGHLNSSGL